MSYYTLRDWATAILAVAGLILALSVAYASCCLGQDKWSRMTLYDYSNKQSVIGLNNSYANDSGLSFMWIAHKATNYYYGCVFWKTDGAPVDTLSVWLGTPDSLAIIVGYQQFGNITPVFANIRGPLAWGEYKFPIPAAMRTAKIFFVGLPPVMPDMTANLDSVPLYFGIASVAVPAMGVQAANYSEIPDGSTYYDLLGRQLVSNTYKFVKPLGHNRFLVIQ
jgi:hypothetical protein